MSAIRLGPRNLLEFNARYGVLICRECQYGIQKNALQSHLLRHKIYREERQRLLSYISELYLFEPEDVPLPTPASPPVDGLPIISGYRCTRCGNLCASSKRMRRHWSEIHGLNNPPKSSFARPAKLQTFFRGTKLRYFEVTSPASPTTINEDNDPNHTNNDNDADDDDLRANDEEYITDTQPSLLSHVPTPREAPGPSPVHLDLETLSYFYHFTTTTRLTLPSSINVQQSVAHYWQIDIVLQALQRQWLMCGLLAVSACHLASLADDTTIAHVHQRRSTQFFAEFSAGFETPNNDIDLGVDEEVWKISWQLRCVLRCAHWAWTKSAYDEVVIPELVAPSDLQSIITTIRSLMVSEHSIQDMEDNGKSTSRSIDTGNFGAFPSSGKTPSSIFNVLRVLPSRMAERLGKPENVQDVLVTLSATAVLAECCNISFASDDVAAACEAMAIWLIKIPEYFHDMVLRQSPAALVVLAHWAALLVKRAEDCGCWFLRGSAKAIQLQIEERLPVDDYAVQGLVIGLTDKI
ncbi:hypothetical protein EYZ11_007602 [Aspergillus tanneri]|uniref:C2H2-type domain-containing protein n=1 Tax=Aspergillus tanneri TaxID=1220188 RepID=A0A4S3JCX6_9EURO|nr:uncharacterized protein ATNIH1004_001771 [Aspergillus tanneri]KAA8652862.1 hypothetical protein ATNIH1004_001771 [Aspergillus tanneri]THC92932.1 hypothetical protein EYZ11_007602 [Aspergillus tanneri]